jgi:hypothetical protein
MDRAVQEPLEIYSGCIQGMLSARFDIEPVRLEISKHVIALDQWCLEWTAAWYLSLRGIQLETFSQRDLDLLNSERREILRLVNRDLQRGARR